LATFAFAWRAEAGSEACLSNYVSWIVRLDRHFADEGGLTRISRDDLTRFMADLTPNQATSVLRAVRAWAKRTDLPDPTAGLRRPKVAELPQPTATALDVEAVLVLPAEQANGAKRTGKAKPPTTAEFRDLRARTVLAVLWSTGLRISELKRLEWADLDLEAGIATIRITKSRKPRVVGLDPRAVQWLARWADTVPAADGVVFPCSLRTLQRDVGRLLGVPPHALRRGFAVSWLQRGGSQTSLQTIAGWSSGVMVSRYAKSLAGETALVEFRRLMEAS
jgi:integrase